MLDKECSSIEKAEQSLKIRQNRHYNKIIEFCHDKGYILLTEKEDIKNNLSQIKYICPLHGECTTKVTNILQGKSCYKCGRQTALAKRHSKTLTDRQEKLYSDALKICEQKSYILNSKKEDIENNRTYIKYICSSHGEQEMRISNLITGRGCPKCSIDNAQKRYSLSAEEVEKRISNCGGTLLNKHDYINQSTRNLEIICPNCKRAFTTSLVLFTQRGGQICSDCGSNESVGELRIRNYLEDKNITFEQEKWFPDCRDINPLPFDFYIPSQKLIIEFDGAQHFAETNYFTYPFEKIKEHDDIKNNYCIEKGIKLIRIPYWDINNIDEMLEKEISHEDIV